VRSLRQRVLLSALLVLILFLILTSLALEQAFRDSASSAREERLLGQLYLLMAAAEGLNGTLTLPEELAEPRFSLPDSGLYGAVLDGAGRPVWRSRSALTVAAPWQGALWPGERRFELRRDATGEDFFVARYGVSWAIGPRPAQYTFAVAEDLGAYYEELARFRTALAGWLGLMGLLMLAALLAAMRWGLAPLRRVAAEVAEVESGAAAQIRGDYPAELRALTDNLNALLAHERARQKRLDNALGDLAHSLKTPLAVIRGALGETPVGADRTGLIDAQVTRMEHIVEHQLQRARAGAGPVTMAAVVPIAQVVERINATLAKVYCDKPIDVFVEGDTALAFRGVEGDLMEILGNLLDNAFKWARSTVQVAIRRGETGVELVFEDDGPGVSPEQAQRVLERGARADESAPGHGIGLAIARDICTAYGGGLSITRSTLGGARVRLRLPA
jgi:two-component system sensor histidine kinase PhoQ